MDRGGRGRADIVSASVVNDSVASLTSNGTETRKSNIYYDVFQSLVHYGDNIGAKIVKCLINENLYETQSLINQQYDIYQVCADF